MTSGGHSHHHHAGEEEDVMMKADSWMERVDRLIGFLDGHFGHVELLSEPARIKVCIDEIDVEVYLDDMVSFFFFLLVVRGDMTSMMTLIFFFFQKNKTKTKTKRVESESENLKGRVRSVVEMAAELVTPLSEF